MKQGHEVVSGDRLMLVTDGTVCTETLGAFEGPKGTLVLPLPTLPDDDQSLKVPFYSILCRNPLLSVRPLPGSVLSTGD